MKTTTFFSVLFFAAHISAGQSWQHFFGGSVNDHSGSVIQSSDGGFVMAGYTESYGSGKKDAYIIKTDANGKMQWQQVIGGAEDDEAYDVVQHPSGDYFIAGETESFGNGEADVWLIKLGSDGSIKWTKTFGGTLEDYAAALLLTSAGEPVMAGETESFGAGGSDAYILKTDTSGILLWSKTYGKTGDDEAYSISKVHDGGFILAGQTMSYSSSYGYAIRTDANGDSLWTKAFSIGSKGAKTFYDVTELGGDTSFAFVGEGGTNNYQSMVIFSTNLSGVTTFSNINYFSSYTYSAATSVLADADGGFTIVGYYSPYYGYGQVVKFDPDGIMQTQKTFSYIYIYYSDFYGSNQFIRLPDNSLVICGSWYVQGSGGNSNNDCTLLKTDSSMAFPIPIYRPPITAHGPTAWCDTTGSVLLTVPPGYRTYQWYRSQYTVQSGMDSALVVTQSGSYYCTMTDEDGIYTTSTIGVTVTPVPHAVVTPAGPVNFCAASRDTILTATAVSGCTYQWFFNGSPISGATLTTYHPLMSGSYSVSLTNSCGADTSAAVIVNATSLPSAWITPFGSLNIVQGWACGASELTTNTQPGATYQWYWNGNPIGYNYYKLCPGAGGNYWVTVSNGCGSVTSDTSVITAYYDNIVIQTSGPVSGCGVDSVKLSLNMGVYCHWYFNGVLIPNANADTLWATQTGTYNVDFQFSCYNCGSTDSWPGGAQISVTINHTPKPSISALGPVSMCNGTVDLIADPAGATYSWYKNAISIPGATGQAYTATTAGTYKCYITTAACGLVASNQIDVTYGPPSGTATVSQSTICTGQSTSISLNNTTANTTYQWLLNGVPVAGATGYYKWVTVGGDYSCILTNGCGVDTTNSVTLTVKPIPPDTIIPSGTVRICPGDSLQLSAPAGNYTYRWYKNGYVIQGATGQQYYAKDFGYYYVYVIDGNCGSQSSTTTLRVGPLPINNIWESTSLKFCGNDSVQLNANTGNGFMYQWMFNGSPIPGATNSVFYTGTSGNYSVQLYDDIGCTDTSNDVILNSQWLGSLSILTAGATNFCEGDSVILYSNTSGTSYQWSFGGTIIPAATDSFIVADTSGLYTLNIINAQNCQGIANASVNEMENPFLSSVSTNASCVGNDGAINLNANSWNTPITYLWSNGSTMQDLSALIPGIYSVTVTDVYGCYSVLSDTIDTTLSPPLAVITSNDTIICQNQIEQLYANTGVNFTYQWQYNGTTIAAATNNYYYADTTGNFTCIVSNSCGPSTSNTIVLYGDSLPNVIISANDSIVCSGDTIVLTANAGPVYTYFWRRNGLIIPGATNSTYAAVVSGNYTVSVNNSCGSVLSDTLQIYNGATVTASVSTNDATTLCLGDNAILQATTGMGYSYQWQLDGVDLAGETDSSTSASLSGTYRCVESNGCMTDTSNEISITVRPQATIQIATLDSLFCPGDSTTLFISASSSNSWQWKLNGINIAGAHDSIYVTSAGGMYSCSASDTCGVGLSNMITLVEDFVPVPSISGSLFTRICLGDSATFSTPVVNGYSYQWYRYQVPIAGATTSSYTVTMTGSYRVQVFDSMGCQKISTNRFVMVGCVVLPPPPPPDRFASGDEKIFDAQVYPNPSLAYFTVTLIGSESKFSLKVYDIMGQTIDQFSELSPEESFQFGENLAPGIYQVEIIQGDQRKNIRIIKD